jgi:predicted site-specific integrase-resolvase
MSLEHPPRGSYSPREFQERHGISHATFWRMVRAGRLAVVYLAPKTVRVPASEDRRFSIAHSV